MDTTRLAFQATPLPEILKQHGYQTIHVGKAHFGAISTPGENPLNLGFRVNIAGHAGGAPKTYHAEDFFGTKPGTKKGPWDIPGLEKYDGQNINLTEALTREAIAETQRAIDDKKPFFLYMAHYGVHTPIMEDNRFYQQYLDRGIDTIEAKYASMIESIDKSLGDILDHVKQNQLTENTIILFMSDNGGLSANSRGGEYHTHNLPLKSGKGSMYEGGIRVPMMITWPKKILSPQRTNTPIIIEDFFPSIIAMAGIKKYETVQQVDGQSLLSIIERPTSPINRERAFVWHYPNKWGSEGPGIGPASTIRKGDWKLIYFHQNQRYELYNIQKDIGEERNLILEERNKANELISYLADYLMKMDAQMPTDKLTGEIIPYPKNL
jgi:arylsulfatase A-like enzyme